MDNNRNHTGRSRNFTTVDGSISFHVAKDNTRQWRNNSINYFFKKASPTANCEIMLNADKPPILSPK